MSQHVWIIEFQSLGKWMPSRDYGTLYITKDQAVQFLKEQHPKGLIYRVAKYVREEPNPRSTKV